MEQFLSVNIPNCDDYTTFNSLISSQTSGVKKKERIYFEATPEIYIHTLPYMYMDTNE